MAARSSLIDLQRIQISIKRAVNIIFRFVPRRSGVDGRQDDQAHPGQKENDGHQAAMHVSSVWWREDSDLPLGSTKKRCTKGCRRSFVESLYKTLGGPAGCGSVVRLTLCAVTSATGAFIHAEQSGSVQRGSTSSACVKLTSL